MASSAMPLDTSADSDSEEYDCQLKSIPREHSDMFQNVTFFNMSLNKMCESQLINLSEKKNLRTDANLDIMRKRLLNHFKMQALIQAKMCDNESSFIPFLVVIDIEATCEEFNSPDHKFEIIEFPAMLVDAINKTIVDAFRCVVKPTINAKLSEFCLKLTSVTQEQIDVAEPFTVCLKKFTQWLERHELGTKHKFCIVTDGSYDMARFLYGQCIMSNIPYPAFAKKWINIRKIFRTFYFNRKDKYSMKCNLQGMMSILNLQFQGSPHNGLDDSYNLAMLCLRLINDGAFLEPNERIIHLKNQTPFGKDDLLPVRPLHNIFCIGVHDKVLQYPTDQISNLKLSSGNSEETLNK